MCSSFEGRNIILIEGRRVLLFLFFVRLKNACTRVTVERSAQSGIIGKEL